jgi:hypothetical protein
MTVSSQVFDDVIHPKTGDQRWYLKHTEALSWALFPKYMQWLCVLQNEQGLDTVRQRHREASW